MPVREMQIHNAVGGAVEYVCANFQECSDMPDTFQNSSPLDSLSDYTVLDISDSVKSAPNQVLLKSPAELFKAIQSFGEFIGASIPNEHIMEDVLHEQEHAMASRTVSFQQIRYHLTVFANSTESIGYRLSQQALDPIHPITKLALASTIAAPNELSQGDKTRLASMGYQGVADLRRRITRNNGRSKRHVLPLPGSLQLAG